MEIILLESLNKLGKAGDIVKVKDGFARNFLIPAKKAIIANKKNKSELNTKMSLISENNKKKISEAEALRNKLEGKTLAIEMEANDEDSLYGSITQKSITETVKKSLSIELSPDQVILTQIKNLGVHQVKLRLYDGVDATINLEIKKIA